FFEKEDGSSDVVSGSLLAEPVNGVEELRLAVLIGCESGCLPRERGLDPYSGVATALVKMGLPAAVALQQSMSITAGKELLRAFYKALAQGRPVDVAMGEARLALRRSREAVGPFEWATPVLTQRTANGRILDLGEGQEGAKTWLSIVSFSSRGSANPLSDEEQYERFGDLQTDLREFFDGSEIKDHRLWSESIVPILLKDLSDRTRPGRKHVLSLAAHASIAFASGYVLEAKCRKDVGVVQQDKLWWPTEGDGSQSGMWSRKLQPKIIDPKKPDLAVVVSLSRDIEGDVRKFIELGGDGTGSIGALLSAVPAGGVSQHKVRDGLHAFNLAEDLHGRISSWQTDYPGACYHFFLCAPNAYIFFHGQLARNLPRIQLYEHGMGEGGPVYRPSIRLESESS
ncbi:MAG: SAVED domain-containing protein, partial [Acidobacteria bacterium]|nr:SAVED domain-containing protein [Acidobacteriota bacterium]